MSSLVVFLHGSGSSGLGMLEHLQMIPLSRDNRTFYQEMQSSAIDIICPTAKSIPYSPYMQEYSTVWFDRSADFPILGRSDEFEDLTHIEQSAMYIHDFINKQEKSKVYDHIFIGGMSMGGGMSLQLLNYLAAFPSILHRIRGMFVISSYLINNSQIFHHRPLFAIPILMMHGRMDSFIRYDWGEATAQDIRGLGYDVDFKSYNHDDHELTSDMLMDLTAWIRSTLARYAATCMSSDAAHMDGDTSSLPMDGDALLSPINGEYINEADVIPYRVMPGTTMNSARIEFLTPFDTRIRDILTARNVLACGSCFEIKTDGMVVYTDVTSPDPVSTGREISRRLYSRVSDGGVLENPCQMS